MHNAVNHNNQWSIPFLTEWTSLLRTCEELLEAPAVGTNIFYGFQISYCFIFRGSYYCLYVLEVELLC